MPLTRLQKLADDVTARFLRAGFPGPESEREGVKLHVTLLNTKWATQRGYRWCALHSTSGQIQVFRLEQYGDLCPGLVSLHPRNGRQREQSIFAAPTTQRVLRVQGSVFSFNVVLN